MDILNVARKVSKIKFFLGLAAVGIVFIIVGVILMALPNGNYIPVDAVVTEIGDIVIDEENGNSYFYTIRYEVNGEIYVVEDYQTNEPCSLGDTITVKYNENDPSQLGDNFVKYLKYILIAIGCALVIAGVVLTVISAKKKVSEMNEYDKIDPSKVSEEDINAVKNDRSPMVNYLFHFDTNLKQGYIMEDALRNPVIEAKMKKLSLFKSFTFEFVNHKTGTTAVKSISHTFTSSIGSGTGIVSYVPISKSFKIDGVNNWDYLASKGIGFKYYLKGVSPCFDVYKNTVQIATITTADVNAMKGSSYFFGNIPVNGIYNVSTKESETENVFMVCMSIARAIFYED
ncbi:MAG: DUF3592 domain-containing protein [Clostridia bacterium]|nr:DUF3592 domain-containing protein [Clostridia bacterium]